MNDVLSLMIPEQTKAAKSEANKAYLISQSQNYCKSEKSYFMQAEWIVNKIDALNGMPKLRLIKMKHWVTIEFFSATQYESPPTIQAGREAEQHHHFHFR